MVCEPSDEACALHMSERSGRHTQLTEPAEHDVVAEADDLRARIGLVDAVEDRSDPLRGRLDGTCSSGQIVGARSGGALFGSHCRKRVERPALAALKHARDRDRATHCAGDRRPTRRGTASWEKASYDHDANGP